jgi:hypothetical protein
LPPPPLALSLAVAGTQAPPPLVIRGPLVAAGPPCDREAPGRACWARIPSALRASRARRTVALPLSPRWVRARVDVLAGRGTVFSSSVRPSSLSLQWRSVAFRGQYPRRKNAIPPTTIDNHDRRRTPTPLHPQCTRRACPLPPAAARTRPPRPAPQSPAGYCPRGIRPPPRRRWRPTTPGSALGTRRRQPIDAGPQSGRFSKSKVARQGRQWPPVAGRLRRAGVRGGRGWEIQDTGSEIFELS